MGLVDSWWAKTLVLIVGIAVALAFGAAVDRVMAAPVHATSIKLVADTTYPQYPDLPLEDLTFDGATATDQLLGSTTDSTGQVVSTGKVLSTTTYDMSTATGDDIPETGLACTTVSPTGVVNLTGACGVSGGVMMPLASGTGGSTSPSGCRTVTVTNVSHTLLGFVAYKYKTWTAWCWTRSSHVISDVHTNWAISNVDSEEQWQGQVNLIQHFYAYHSSSTPTSGYYHYRQGHFSNCVFKIGCVRDSYPTNKLWSHANGTWAWSAVGG